MTKSWKEYAADWAVHTTSGIVVGVVVGVAVTALTSNPAFGIIAGKATAGGVIGGGVLS
ncbi:hypothetical protein [Nostoc sp. UHCC 0870]|uniref:hypothetical protein n=1 Tax=Nostoc sp. UHCC 0870 TaxID=2914041 RepID=UPI001EDCB0A1|nr:hypothetical protein [Nostoc sp. UHCC 0870]UKO98504.1 hypothetical protein L6494_01845 [Nostoc sp. UHCC 0870]